MKKVYFLLLLLLTVGIVQLKAQDIDSLAARQITIKMTDSLLLTQSQADSIYKVSRDTRIRKKEIWSQYRGSTELKERLSQEDINRDSLYYYILGADKYLLYLKKKFYYLLIN